MTSTEIRDLFLLKFDINGNVGVGFTDSEIEDFLNMSLAKYYQELIKNFEINESFRKSLSRYTTRVRLTTEASSDLPERISPGTKFYDVTDILKNNGIVVEAHVSHLNNQIDVRPIKHDYYWSNIKNKYKKPYEDLVWRLDVSSNGKLFHELVFDPSTTFSEYTFTYVEDVPKISISNNTEIMLPDKDIDNIVDLSVRDAEISLGLTSGK